MFNLVIAGFDGSAGASRAVDWAAREAADRSATLEIVSCFEVPWLGHDSGMTLEQIREISQTADDAVRAEARRVAAALPYLTVRTATDSHPPTRALRAESRHADLVVIGAAGRPHRSRRQRGATARVLCRHSNTPVAVIPIDYQLRPIHRIVVGVDEHGDAAAAVRWAVECAVHHHAELDIIHGESFNRSAPQIEWLLHAAAEQGRSRGVVTRIQTVSADGATALLAAAEHADLLVVGKRRTSAVTAAVFGSCTDTLIQQSPIPVVAVRPEADR